MRFIGTVFALSAGSALAFAPATIRPAVHRAAPITSPIAAPITSPINAQIAAPVVRAATPTMLTGLEGPGLVSAIWVLVGLNFMPLGPTAAMTGMSPGQQKWGDRVFMNLIEQAPLFMVALWTHALFVSATVATNLGLTYLGLRLLYPFIWAIVGGDQVGPPFPALFFSTFPQYGVAFYMALATVMKLGFGICLNTLVKCPLLVAPIGFGGFLYAFALYFVPILQKNIFSKAFTA